MADDAPSQSIARLFDEATIAARVDALAGRIASDMPRDVLIVVILKGSFVFAADLIRALDRRGMLPRIDFMTLSSYGEATRSSGKVTLVRDISEDVTGRTVLIVDDILESGHTLKFARDLLMGRGAAVVRSCLLLDKKQKRVIPIEADYVGFEIGDQFIVGYGLDYAHYYRSLPYIGVVETAGK